MQLHQFPRPLRAALGAGAALAILSASLWLFAHRTAPFAPDYPRTDLAPLLDGAPLTAEEYGTVFRQTGLGRAGVDALLARGEAGRAVILEAQDAFFRPAPQTCQAIGPFSWEDRFTDKSGGAAYGFPLAPAQEGDVFLSFSTHTLGWRHGHAGLAADGAGSTLEAVYVGTDSGFADVNHWRCYSTFLHLRLRDVSPEVQAEIAAFAREHLDGVPYSLFSGLTGPKAPPPGGAEGAQCAWLVWYALWQAGYDADADGGRLVTVSDLAASPLFEVVQLYGLDPGDFPGG